MAMKCPKCDGELAPTKFEDVEIDRCNACKGLWFDAFEHEELRRREGSQAIDTGKPVPATGGGSKLCPRCSVKMIDMVVAAQPHIKYESCGVCHGAFFDAGEFLDFRVETFGETLRAISAAVRK
jgi:Zn-finger nucleic acid-binding protein